MKYCSEPISRWFFRIWFYLMLYLVVNHAVDFYKALQSGNVVDSVFFGFGFVFISSICAAVYNISTWINRKYQLLSEGLLVAYPHRKSRMIPWSDVYEVAVCRIHRVENRSNGEIALRVALGETFAHSENPRGAWQTVSFSVKYRNYVIVFDYDEELVEEFARVCPIPIQKLPT